MNSKMSRGTPPQPDIGSSSSLAQSNSVENVLKFPWRRESSQEAVNSGVSRDAKCGEYIIRNLFLEFCKITERRIELVLAEPLERPLSKSLQRGEDPQFDQVLSALGNVAEHSLPSILKTLFAWYDRQMKDDSPSIDSRQRHRSKGSKDYLCERRDLAVEFVYCLVLIEVLTKLSYHPGHEDLVGHIITQCFKHFKYKDGLQSNPNASNINIIADLYAEVVGVLATSRFLAIRKKFTSELKELKLRDQTPYTAQSIISLLMGLKFFRVKMHPIEEFELCVHLLLELGHYFVEVKDRDIKHALAGLFVEILLPVASIVKNEVNIPVLKKLVDDLYTVTVDMATKRKHTLHLFPLVTCLLCVSQKRFFLDNWHYFLSMCLSQLKNRDVKMSRVALESLYRLLWVYMVRIKCESNTATQSRLQSIVNSLFPKGSRLVTPKDMPLNIFVKIIQFIAKERLDFAVKDIIFDLLCVGRGNKFLTPERMSIGLRAFLVIADSLQQKDGDPPMPQSTSQLPSGSTVRVKKTFLNKMLSDTTAKSIGLAQYYPYILKTFDSILRALDLQVGRSLLMTKSENANKEPEEMITGDRKPKLDLFRTCIAAIPRLIPDGMTSQELVELLTRLTVHVDEELKVLAVQALQNLMSESTFWREQVVHGFVQFIQKDISDTKPTLLDSSLRLFSQLLVQWKTTMGASSQKDPQVPSANIDVLHEVEGLCLVMMCSCRIVTRKLALHLLKEVRNIFNMYTDEQIACVSLLEVIDKTCPTVLEKMMPLLPTSEKPILLTLPTIDLAWVMDRAVTLWLPAGGGSMQDGNQINYSFHRVDMWIRCIAEFASHEHAQSLCPVAVAHAWPIVYARLNALFPLVDPSAQTEQTRASSILRSGSKKGTSEKDVHMQLWQNYVILACTIAMHVTHLPVRCASPELGSASSPESDKALSVQACSVQSLFQRLVPLMRCDSSDMRDTIVNGLGYCNPAVFKELAEELLPFLKEAIDKKQDNLRRRRKRDILRVQLAHIFELMAENKAFALSESGVIDVETGSLSSMFVDYIDGARQYLEGENDRDLPILQEIRLHFSGFVQHLICNTPMEYRKNLLSRDLRYSLFHLFANWSGHFNLTFGPGDKRHNKEEPWTDQELSAARAMSAVLCCGKVFDSNGLNDDGYIYHWLDTLLSSHDDKMRAKIYELAKETVFLLLDFNPEVQGLLDWVIDRCYTGHNEVADGCFNALAAVFQTKEYPCDHVAMLNLAVLNVGSPRISTHETAIQLLHLLDVRFFQEAPVFRESSEDCAGNPTIPLNDILLSVSYCNSQIFVSDQLARLHTDLTMPMFSEITQRFQTARPSVRQTLLKYLLPWLHNMELVDPSLPQSSPLASFLTRLSDTQTDVFMPPLKGEGWGSTQATEMVLNNLFYITVTFGDEHPLEIEALWSALVSCWPFNLKVIIRYLVIITNIAATDLLPYAKRVVTFLGRAKPEKLVDELMNELQTVETLNVNIERTQTPPYYRLSVIKKIASGPNATDDEKQVSHVTDYQLEKGILHTKRHSANEEVQQESTPRTESTASLKSITSNSTESTAEQMVLDDDVIGPAPLRGVEMRRSESPAPYPLPMPAYGGYFAPLNECLPENFTPTPGFHRSNIAVMFLCDLVLDGLEVDWSPHLPLMLHVIFLGLDHSRALVYEHCKKLLQNLLLLASSQEQVSQATSRLLLSFRGSVADTLKVISEDRDAQLTLETPSRDPHTQYITKSTFSIDSSATMTADNMSDYTDPEMLTTVDDVIRAMLSFMETRKGRPLWSSEDITPKMLSTQSATHLSYFLKYTVKCFKELSPLALVEQRWSQVALQLALSCSSRHYAGRSFQILRALQIRPSTQMLSDILSRLVETVAEQGEDMQGYVTEMMLTLEASIDNLDLEVRRIDFMRELFMSTPNLAKDVADSRRSAITAPKQVHPHHARSTSYTVSAYTQRAYAGGVLLSSKPTSKKASVATKNLRCRRLKLPVVQGRYDEMEEEAFSDGDGRIRSCTEVESRKTNLGRSRSAQSLKNLDQSGGEDKLTLVTQMFWITVSLLESDYEYEFSLAVRLLDKILCHLQPERPECRDKLDKVLNQIKWPNFPGVYILLLKGCTSHVAAESTWALLSKIVLAITSPIMDPTGCWGFPMVTIALLPYLVHNYENPSQVCRDAADRVAQMCGHLGDRMSNLGTVMSLYSRGTFSKDSFQWTKCVVKYLFDEYSSCAISMVSYLVEILEKGQAMYQAACLQILYCMVHYLDIVSAHSAILNQELFQSVNKFVQNSNWREALKILKLAVTRSSTLAAPPPSSGSSSSSNELAMFSHTAHTSFAEAESLSKFSKELPGRTLEFSIDMSKTAIIGRKFIFPEVNKPAVTQEEKSVNGSAVSLSRKPSNNQDLDSVWRRPHASQARTRERLVNLLTCFGQRVGLPKSPSDTVINKVIFSQSSDTLDHQTSVAGSSGEETSLPDASSNDNLLQESSGNELMVTFKGFDFLDNELEESEPEDWFPQLVDRRHSFNYEHSPNSGRHSFGSEPNLQLISAVPRVVSSPRDSEALTDDESESSDQEASAATATSDSAGICALIQVNNSAMGRRGSSPRTASTQSLSSNAPSESDTVDLNSSQASPGFSQLSALLLNLPADEVEEAWKAHVAKVMVESSVSHVSKTCQIFPKLFKELRKRLTTMTKEACYYISKSENLKAITSQILQVLDLVHQQLDCPFMFTESDSLIGIRLVDRHKFCVLELQECFETYSSRKDQAEHNLESLKSSIKQQSLGDGGSFPMVGEEQQMELCHRLYKLIFQLILLFESYLKLLDIFTSVTASPQVSDMSNQVMSMQSELMLALRELDNGQASPFNVDTKVVNKLEAVTALAEYLTGGQYARAVQILRCFRSLWPNDIFGLSTEDDVLTLLNIYCSSLAEKKSGVFALTQTNLELSPLYGQLMDVHVRLGATQLSPPPPPVTTAAAATTTTTTSFASEDSQRTQPHEGRPRRDSGGISPARLEVLLRSSDSSIL